MQHRWSVLCCRRSQRTSAEAAGPSSAGARAPRPACPSWPRVKFSSDTAAVGVASASREVPTQRQEMGRGNRGCHRQLWGCMPPPPVQSKGERRLAAPSIDFAFSLMASCCLWWCSGRRTMQSVHRRGGGACARVRGASASSRCAYTRTSSPQLSLSPFPPIFPPILPLGTLCPGPLLDVDSP